MLNMCKHARLLHLRRVERRYYRCGRGRFYSRHDTAHRASSVSGTVCCTAWVPAALLSLGAPLSGGGGDSSCRLGLFWERCTTTELNIEVSTTSWAGAGVMPIIKIAVIVAVGVSKEKTRFMGLVNELNNPIKKVG